MSEHIVEQATVALRAGFRLRYLAAGPDRRERILFVHGSGAGAEQFGREVRAYADLLPTVAVSLRGHAGSGLPADQADDAFSARVLATDVGELLDHLGAERAHVVANSVGGLVALELLAARPQRVASLVTFGTTAVLNTPRVLVGLVRAVPRGLAVRASARWFARTAPSTSARPLVQALHRAASPRAIAGFGDNFTSYDYRAVLRTRTCPWLLVRGAGDRLLNRQLDTTVEAGRAVDGFAVADLPDAGHFANLDDPDGFDAAVRPFIAEAAGTHAPRS